MRFKPLQLMVRGITMPNRMQEQIRLNPILSDPKQDILIVNAEVIRLQDEAAGDPDHWLHDGLKAHFEARQQQLAALKR
jgi:hypothetical protein